MADFSLPLLFVVPAAQTALPTTGSTQNLTAGQVGLFRNDYTPATAANIAAAPYFQVFQGREVNYLQGSKRSDKIKGGTGGNVTEWYKVVGCPTAGNQITDISGWSVQCGEKVTVTLRAHSSYIDTLYFNGLTRSVVVNAPCCDCDSNPCTDVDVPALIDSIIEQLEVSSPSTAPENVSLSTFFTFERVGDDADAILRIHGKPLTVYGQPCDIAANPFEYDRMWFQAFVYEGPATTADFIVADACSTVATVETVQDSFYPIGTSAEVKQLEINNHSYAVGFMKHLFKVAGFNPTFESQVADGQVYDLFYIKFNEFDRSAYVWGDYIPLDNTVIIAAVAGSTISGVIETALVAALGAVTVHNACQTTTTTTTAAPTTTTTTTAG